MIKVLDHGEVRLIDYMGSDLQVSSAARVLEDVGRHRGEADIKLIKYMWNNGHTSPFEHVVFTFYVKAPIFVIRQWQRHRTWSYNEFSARYKEVPDCWYVPDPSHIGVQSLKNHQSRIISADGELLDYHASEVINQACESAFRYYDELLTNGVPREIARGVLPVNTYTEMWATVNLNNLFKFLTLRMDEHAQFEIREYANALLELIKPVVPNSVEAYLNS